MTVAIGRAVSCPGLSLANRGVLRPWLVDTPLRCHGVKETFLDNHHCRQQPASPDTAVTSASAWPAATPSTSNGAARSNVPDWLVRLAIRLLPSALLCPLTVLVVLGLVENGDILS